MAASVTRGRALRYAEGSARGLLHHHPGHCLHTEHQDARGLTLSLGRSLRIAAGIRHGTKFQVGSLKLPFLTSTE
jgi:hypothetical protein